MADDLWQAPIGPCPWTCLALAGVAATRALSRVLLIRRFRRELRTL